MKLLYGLAMYVITYLIWNHFPKSSHTYVYSQLYVARYVRTVPLKANVALARNSVSSKRHCSTEFWYG